MRKYWFSGSPAATHLANGVNLLFPAGERFFVRSVRHYLARLEDEGESELAMRVRGFFGQEGRHAQAHERFFEAMRAAGLEIDDLLAWYERTAYEHIEKRTSPALHLAVTVALEHFTAILAEDALGEPSPLAHADVEMRRLLEWHAAEELEHKSVAFDVLRAVHPSYALRIAGLAIGTACLAGFWLAATRELLRQEGMTLLDGARELAELRRAASKERGGRAPAPVVTRVFLRGILEYMHPAFHPDDHDHRELVARTLARLEAEGILAPAAAKEPGEVAS